jgi:antirestriction protein ArdC
MASLDTTKPSQEIQFRQLLEQAVSKPGLIMEGYSRFWRYSIGNQLLALVQCYQRGIQPGALATYPKWKELGRYVRKGEKALVLCQPVTRKRAEKDPATGEETVHTWQSFTYRAAWFVISQTEGQDVPPEPIPAWNRERALSALGIEQIAFETLDGNVQGYARGRQIAINPLAQMPAKTTFHELAHIELGHTSEAVHDSEALPRSLREVEAESVALLCLESLGMEGSEYARGYIQSWLAGAEIPERSAQRIFAAADKILKSGYEEKGGAE